MFIELDDDQVAAMGSIVTKYDVYNDIHRGSYADLFVIVLAKSRNLTVLTSERTAPQISMKNPLAFASGFFLRQRQAREPDLLWNKSGSV